MAGSCKTAVPAVPLLLLGFAARAGGVRVGAWGNETSAGCQKETLCVVSANKLLDHDKTYMEAFKACMEASKDTSVVALALQDQTHADVPKYVKNVPGLEEGARFKLRHQVMLSHDVGEGRVCYFKFDGGVWATAVAGGVLGAKVGVFFKGVGAIPGTLLGFLGGAFAGKMAKKSLGVSCGGVSVAIYSLRKVDVGFDINDPKLFSSEGTGVNEEEELDRSWTTIKGTVAATFAINERQVVVASTHAAEGIRGKKKGSKCPAVGTESVSEKDAELIEQERKRVRQFRSGLGKIQKLREMAEGAAVVWAGDFNPRTADPATGCPLWPDPSEDPAAGLERLRAGRDVLGEDPKEPGKLASFTGLLKGTDIQEIEGLACPTYKKDKDNGKGDMFRCSESGLDMYYKASHPASWPDRIFGSAREDSKQPWLQCGRLHRVAHASDHDAVLVACDILSKGCFS